MKLLFLLFLSLSVQSYDVDCNKITSTRAAFHEITTESQLDQFIQDTEEENCREAQPYLASAIMQKAKYAFFPTSKFRYFNQGKELLEKFIEAYPNNLEARYVRVLVQRNIPSLLGYKDNIESDIKFINSYIKEANLPSDFKNVILSNIN